VAARWARKFWGWVTRNPRRQFGAAVITLVLVAGATAGAVVLVKQGNKCQAGFYRGATHECVGVSDGSYDFIPELHDVDQAILAQNQYAASTAAAQHGALATVALLLPLTSTSPVMQTEILHEVQGAYVAQYRGNNDANAAEPLIRLVLANPGADSAEYLPVVRQLEAMTAAPDNLRVVTGISVSTATTKAEVQWLTANGIPVVGGPITADDIANSAASYPFPGLARIEPTNDQEARALARFVGGVSPRQAVIVEDTRQDDDYITTLAKWFTADSAYQPYPFQSAQDENQAGDTANTFQNDTVPELCSIAKTKNIRWIYFAGRQVQLRLFINALAAGCQGATFTILTGSSASHLANDPLLDTSAFRKGILTLEYAAIAAPGMAAPGYSDFAGAMQAQSGGQPGEIGPISFTDGQSIINYDAVLTAIAGVRRQTGQSSPLPTLQQVAANWGALEGVSAVPGASGEICLENDGNPYDKLVPIVRYSTGGNPLPVGPAWPAGIPLASPCAVPSNAG
jgi:hypothetical protein